MTLAIVFVSLLGLLALFQLALAAGAPWGRFAWGGQHPRRLPAGYRIASLAAIAIYALCALIALDRAGAIDVLPSAVSRIGMWVVFGFLALGVVLNAISKSRYERLTMTPVAAVLAVLALLIALAAPPAPPTQTLTGLVVGTGSTARLCTGPVILIYPPQCDGPGSIELTGWDWNSTTYQQEGQVRWGHYAVTGTLTDDVMHVSGATAA